MVKIEYEKLDENTLKKLQNDEELEIIYNNESFYFKLYLKEKNPNLVVFSNGAVNREKKNPPLYMRSTWSDEIDANTLYIDDKTIHDSKLRIGWGVGRQDKHYIPIYVRIVKKISSILKIASKKTYYYGSSAGGFMSILMAAKHQFSTAIINNPQTFVFNFSKGHVNDLCNEVFPGMTREDIINRFENRLSAIKALKDTKHIPPIYYFQNEECERDMNQMYNPFIQKIKDYNIPNDKFTYILYHDKKRGHDPMPKGETIFNINSILKKK